MPVLPVLLKRVVNSESYRKSVSLLITYLRKGSKGRSEEKESEEGTGEGTSEGGWKIRLAIPKPTMTGLMSFVRGGGGTRVEKSVGMESFGQLDSVDDDYHRQLKALPR